MEIESVYIYDNTMIHNNYSDLMFNYIYIIELSDYKKIGYEKIHQI